MELRQAEYVLAVIDEGSFTAGASAVGVAQPSLSESIRKLEDELGVRLFHRVGRSITLTDAGRAFEGPARRLVRDRELVMDAVGSVRSLDHGTLDIVSLPTLAAEPLATLVGRFRVAHPGVVVHLAEPDDTHELEARVADGRSELGLAELPPRNDDLVAIKLARQEIVVVCPPRSDLVSAGRLPVARLAGAPLVTTPHGTSTRDLVERALAGAGIAPTIAVETSQREAIGPLVLAGAGISFLPAAMAEVLAARGAVVARLVPGLSRTIGILHRASPLTPTARAFVELARTGTTRSG